jgi:hypothetical protein
MRKIHALSSQNQGIREAAERMRGFEAGRRAQMRLQPSFGDTAKCPRGATRAYENGWADGVEAVGGGTRRTGAGGG